MSSWVTRTFCHSHLPLRFVCWIKSTNVLLCIDLCRVPTYLFFKKLSQLPEQSICCVYQQQSTCNIHVRRHHVFSVLVWTSAWSWVQFLFRWGSSENIWLAQDNSVSSVSCETFSAVSVCADWMICRLTPPPSPLRADSRFRNYNVCVCVSTVMQRAIKKEVI